MASDKPWSTALPFPPPAQPFRIKRRPAATWFRIHPFDAQSGRYAGDAFNDSARGNARFSPLHDPITGQVIPTIYLAATEHAAISEVLFHDIPTPSTGYVYDLERHLSSNLHLSQLQVADLRLADLHVQGLQAAGLAQWELFAGGDTDYARTRQWGLYIWQSLPQAQGLVWTSRRDDEAAVMMVFADRVGAGDLRAVGPPSPIRQHQRTVLEVLDRLGCGIISG
jgi:hypothetical protein